MLLLACSSWPLSEDTSSCNCRAEVEPAVENTGRRGSKHRSQPVKSPADAVLPPRPRLEEEEAGGVTSLRNFLPLGVAIGGGAGCISRYSFLACAGEKRADSGIEDEEEVDDVSSSCAAADWPPAPALSPLGRTSLPPMWWIVEDPSAPTTTMLFLVDVVYGWCEAPAGS